MSTNTHGYRQQYSGDIVGLAHILSHESLGTAKIYAQVTSEELTKRVEQIQLNACGWLLAIYWGTICSQSLPISSRFFLLIVLLLNRHELRSFMNIQLASDAQLLTQALAGDADAFGDLYERYLDAIYHYMFYRVNGREVAEDLTEAVFLRAWQALDTNPPREAPFRFWLYRIAHNAVVDYYRTRKDQVELEAAAHLPDPMEGPEDLMARQERANALERAMLRLKENHQQVLTCRFIIGLGHAETAVVMSRSEEAVRALQYRAVNALRKLLIIQGSSHE
jgi:RNA polymerase sigma-70 factor (ECF subfamily)